MTGDGGIQVGATDGCTCTTADGPVVPAGSGASTASAIASGVRPGGIAGTDGRSAGPITGDDRRGGGARSPSSNSYDASARTKFAVSS